MNPTNYVNISRFKILHVTVYAITYMYMCDPVAVKQTHWQPRVAQSGIVKSLTGRPLRHVKYVYDVRDTISYSDVQAAVGIISQVESI